MTDNYPVEHTPPLAPPLRLNEQEAEAFEIIAAFAGAVITAGFTLHQLVRTLRKRTT